MAPEQSFPSSLSKSKARYRHLTYYLARVENYWNDFDALAKDFDNILHAASYCIEQGLFDDLATLVRDLGEYLFYSGQWSIYKNYVYTLLSKNVKMDVVVKLKIISRLAEIEQASGNYERAVQLYKQLQEIEQTTMVRDYIGANITRQLAKVLILQGKNKDAQEILLRRLNSSNQYKERVDITIDLVDLYVKGEQLVEAEQLCEDGIKIARNINYSIGEIDLLMLLAKISKRKGAKARASELYQRCQELAFTIGDQERLIRVNEELIQVKKNVKKNKVEKIKVFISYAREDTTSAQKLFHDLEQMDMDVWFDQESLLGGENWKLSIQQAIKDSRFFIALLSKNSINKKGYVQKEIKEALEVLDEYPASQIFFLPVRLENCNPIHPKLSDLQWVDMFPIWDDGFARIKKAIMSQPK